MEVKIVELPPLKVVGVEIMAAGADAQTEMDAVWEEAGRLELSERITNRVEPDVTLAFISNWSETEPFTFLLAVEVSEPGELSQRCVFREFQSAAYAVFEMPGLMPNVTEPWPDIEAWFKRRGRLWTRPMNFRRFDERTGRGELFMPIKRF